MKALIAYFSPEKADANGLYYDDKWYINNDNAIDVPIDISYLDKISHVDEKNIDQEVQKILHNRLYSRETQGTYAPG